MADLLREHSTEIRAAAQAVSAANIRMLGSVARGEETRESDIDLLLDFPARERRLFPLLKLAAEIEGIVGGRVDTAAVEVMAEPVREQAVPL